jgi:hypothetical protein
MIPGTVGRLLTCGRCREVFTVADPGAASWVFHTARADGTYCGGFADAESD